MGAPRTAPKAFPRKKSTTLQYLFNLDSEAADFPAGHGSKLPSPSPESETEELLSIISYCTKLFTFTDPSESPSQQDLKRHKLSQILSILRSTKRPFSDDKVLISLLSMISTNLFRPLPPPSYPCVPSNSPDDEVPVMVFTASWPHLHIVYDILVALLMNSDPKALRNHINNAFLLNLVSLFQTEDPRERDRLKNVYHQIYSKLTCHRLFMRRSMNNVFLHFAVDMDRHCGIGELLEIWGSIINGFTVPLKDEHKLFLMRVLIPLHKPKGMHAYHRQLAYCVSQFVQKEAGLGEVVVKGILRYWPVTNCQKEVLLIGELEDLVDSTDPEQFGKIIVPLCSQIARCLSSSNSQVAERALYMWNNEQFVRMASQWIEEVLPVVVESIEKNIRWHWSKSVQQLTVSVKKMLEEMEPRLYSKCLQELDQMESTAGQEEMKREEKWKRLELVGCSQ